MPIVWGSNDIVIDGLVLYIDAKNPRCYPGSGTAVYDLSPRKNDGTLINNPPFSSEYGGSFTIPNTSPYIELSKPASLPIGTSDRTVMAFCRTPSALSQSFMHVIHWGTPTADQSFGIAVFSNGGLNTHPWVGAPSQGTVVADRNYCLTVSYSSGLHKFWINAVSQGAGVTRNINTGTTTARIGVRISAPLEFWSPNGKIFSVLVYDRVLTDAEILKNYNSMKRRYGI